MKGCLLWFLCLPFVGGAQQVIAGPTAPATDRAHYFVTAEWQGLYSTHQHFFHGVSLMFERQLTPCWRAGFGTEYSIAPYHNDNGWKLYHLKFLPMLADVKYRVMARDKMDVYLEASPGLSFIQYDKTTESSGWVPYPVHETGLYLYGGSSVRFAVAKNLQSIVGVGVKGFHMSFNNLDVNPHGFVGRAGLQYSFPGSL